jgi:hypothetical protein
MFRHRLFRFALVAVLSAGFPAVQGCGSDDQPPGTNLSIADVVREGAVTDGQLRAVLANAPEDWAWAGGRFRTPANGDALPSDAPFEFTWKADATVDAPAAGAPNDLEFVHLLVFSTATEPNLLRVFSDQLSYTPDADAWEILKTAGERGAITLSLTSATLMGDALVDDGGPFIGQTLSFTIE